MPLFTYAVAFCLIVQCCCVQLRLFKDNARMSNASTIASACSLTECAARFVNNNNSRAFSFYADGDICELSSRLPEESHPSNGWKVYSTIEPLLLMGGKYYISNVSTTWEKAKTFCESMTARLVIIDDESEQTLLESIIGTDMMHWIGLLCSGTFNANCTWIDGRQMEGGYTNWIDGKPGNEKCVWLGKGNMWSDALCGRAMYYICEYVEDFR